MPEQSDTTGVAIDQNRQERIRIHLPGGCALAYKPRERRTRLEVCLWFDFEERNVGWRGISVRIVASVHCGPFGYSRNSKRSDRHAVHFWHCVTKLGLHLV
jgi:hypothetical protein